MILQPYQKKPFFISAFNHGFEQVFQRFAENEHASLQMEFFQIISIVSFTELMVTTLKGRIVNVFVGRDSVGSLSIRGALHSADGDIAISSSREVVKCCVGSKSWMLMRLALSRKEADIDGFDKQY